MLSFIFQEKRAKKLSWRNKNKICFLDKKFVKFEIFGYKNNIGNIWLIFCRFTKIRVRFRL
jgi:hypothetical protein